MRNAAHYGRCMIVAKRRDGSGPELAQNQMPVSSLDDDPGFDLTVYSSVGDFQSSLIQDFGMTPEEAQKYTRCGVMLRVSGRQAYIFNRDGNYGRLDVDPKQAPNLIVLQAMLKERINSA